MEGISLTFLPCLQHEPKYVYTITMNRFFFGVVILTSLLLPSCYRAEERDYVGVDSFVADDAVPEFQPPLPPPPPPASPMAVLQAGEFPLWFQFTDEGPILIETIQAARYSAALIPWPHALHVRFILAQGGDLLMAVNHDGFIRLSPWQGTGGIGLYHIFGGELWRQYTVGAFVNPNPEENPVALLYLNEWFLYLDIPPPSPRLWSFNVHSAVPHAVSLPSLDAFAPEDGWNLDTLLLGGNDRWYFRADRRIDAGQELLLLRTDSFEREGERVSLGEFQNAARPEPLSSSPPMLMEMLAVVFAESDSASAQVVSPAFQSGRHFAGPGEGTQAHAFFSPGDFLLATCPEGNGLYVEAENLAAHRFSLPTLPEGFVYTGIGMVGDTVFASWEEQVGFSIGAAGFMALRPQEIQGNR